MKISKFIDTFIISKLDPDEKLILTVGKKQSIPYGVNWADPNIPSESRYLERVYNVLLEGNMKDEAHFCLTTHKEIWREATEKAPWNPRYGVYRTKRTAVRWIGFCADDIQTKVPVSRLRGMIPTFLCETSFGNFQYLYLFETPVADMRLASAFLLQAKAMGLTDAGGLQAGKLARLPTGINTKDSTRAAAQLAEGSDYWRVRCPTASGIRYDVLDLAKGFGMDVDALINATRAETGFENANVVAMPGTNRYADVSERVNQEVRHRNRWGEKLLLEMIDHGLVKTPSDQIESRRTDQGGFIDIVCPWVEEHSHGGAEDSMGGTQFSPIGFGPSDHADYNQFICRHDHCVQADRNIHELKAWAIDKGFIGDEDLVDNTTPTFDKKLQELLNNSVFVADIGRVHDIRDPYGAGMSVKSAHMVLAPWVKNKTPVFKAWTYHKSKMVVERQEFRPGKGLIFTPENSLHKRLNLWTPTAIQARPCGEWLKERLDRHFEQITGDELECRFGKAFVASSIVFPWVRLKVAWLNVCTTHRMGRGTVGEMVRALLGPGCFRKVRATDITDEKYNDWAIDCSYVDVPEFIVFNSLDSTGQRAIMDNIKQMVTEQVIEVNRKYGRKGQEELHCNICISTNHEDAMRVDREDGRFGITFSDKDRLPDQHFADIYHALGQRDLLEQMMGYFTQVDGADGAWIRDMQTAPLTQGKEAMIEATTSVVERIIRSLLERDVVDDKGKVVGSGSTMPWLSQSLIIAVRNICIDTEGAGFVAKLADNKLMGLAAKELRRWGFVNSSRGQRKKIGTTMLSFWSKPDDPLRRADGKTLRYHNAEFFQSDKQKGIRSEIHVIGE